MFDIFDPFYLQKQHEAQQQAAAQLAGQGGTGDLYNSMAPEQHQSFLDRAYESSLGGLDYIGKVLDKTFGGRAIRGLLGGKPQEALSVIPFSDTLGITDPNNIIHGKDLLDNVGLTTPGQESFLGTLAGTATEMALDPSTYLGIGPATAAGKAAIKAGTATKGLAAGIRAGERGLIGFGLPFGESKLLLGTGQGGAAIAEGIPKALGAAAYAPVQAATYAAKPFEWLTGVNPVTKAYDAGSSLAGGLGRAINTHFNPDVAGATTSIGQDIGANVFTPAVKDYKVPLNQARAAAIEELNPILQRGPQAERALFEGMQLAMERPKDPTAFAPNVLREYQQTVGELGQKLSQGEIGQAAFDAGEQAARGQRDDMLARLAQNEKFFATRTPESAWAKGGLTPEEMQLAQKHAGVFSDLNAQMLADEAAKGLNTNSLDDIIGYSTRQLQSMPKAEGEGLWNYLGRRNREGSAAFDVTQKAREDVFRNVPGGTTAIDELIRDPNLRKMAPDQLEAALNAHLTGNATPPGHFPAVNQARELADLIQTRDPRYATDQLDYFKKNIFDTLGMKGEAHARKMAMADSVLASISDKTAKPAADFLAANRASLPVTEVLDKAGFKQGGPGYQQVISGLGLTNGKDLKGLHVPEDVAADVMRLGEAWKTPAALAPVVQAWDTMMNSFKTSVTAAFPAFHTRNVMSGLFNMWRDSALSLDAMKEAQAIQRGGLMTDTMAAKLFPGKTVEEATSLFKQELLANNVAYTRQTRGIGADVLGPTDKLTNYSVPLTTGQQKPLKDIASDYFKGFLPTDEAKKAGYSSAQQLLNPFLTEGVGADANIFRPVAQGRAVGEAAEDWMRSAHYMAKREAGFAPEVAAESVAKYHIDYSNLTQTEKQVMKRLVPWYCMPVDHQILTREGFKYSNQLIIGEEVMAYNHDGELVWTPLIDVNEFDYDGMLQVYECRGASFECTQDHSWVTYTAANKLRVLRKWSNLNSNHAIVMQGEFNDEDTESILSPRHAAILGWVLTDGHMRWRDNHCEMVVYQSEGKFIGGVKELLGVEPRKASDDREPHAVYCFAVKREDVEAITKVVVSKEQAREVIGYLSREAAEEMLQAMLLAKGCTTKRTGQTHFAQSPKNWFIREAFQTLCLMTGRLAFQSSMGCYLKNKKAFYHKDWDKGQVQYKGKIWCPTTKFGTWVVKHAGAVSVTGNTFSRRNLPPVLEDLATQPAKVAQTVRAVAGTRDNNQWAPSYIAEGASLPLPGATEGTNRYLSSFGLPVEDEAIKLLGNALSGNLKRTFQSALGMGSPILKAPYEQAFDQQLFSGRRLSDLDPSPTVSLGGLIPDRAAQVLTQLVSNTPAARLVSTIDRATDRRKWDGTLIPNLLTGLKVSDVDLAKAKPAAEREFLQDALRPAPQTKTREEVYVPANKKGTLSPEDQLLLDLLTGLNSDQQKAARLRKQLGQ